MLYTSNANVHISRMPNELYTRSYKATKVGTHGETSLNMEKVSALTPI